jgi:hypothetical protein
MLENRSSRIFVNNCPQNRAWTFESLSNLLVSVLAEQSNFNIEPHGTPNSIIKNIQTTNFQSTLPYVCQLIGMRIDTLVLDAITSCRSRNLHDFDGRPPWLPLYPRAAELTLPLPRRTSKQHSIQPIDEVLCCKILGIYACWIL